MTKRFILCIIVVLFTFYLRINVNAQGFKKINGDTSYVYMFNRDAKILGLDDLRRVQNTKFNVRIWSAGKLIDLRYLGDTIEGISILYLYTDPIIVKGKSEIQIVNEKRKLNRNEIDLIDKLIVDLKKLEYKDYNYNTDTISKREGGVAQCLEISDSENYVLLSERIWPKKMEILVETIVDTLKMQSDHQLFFLKQPTRASYSWGYTTSVYKATRFEFLLRKLKFWE